MINVIFFASLREALGTAAIQWPAGAVDIHTLTGQLCAQGEPWASALARHDLLCARNQQLCDRTESVQDGDEIAFFPPVTGG
ncbi:MoaD/ThiS family protein [Thalassolituus marinus]|uniref:Molybdopterin synthase sulfur carrier subunit n=1 Tax=Thalassolituus marinus TaxID=671053 RepID=A0ABS7ZPU6_9GAMM|nr:MoaD/ThiS family protein [Thalassolituus marinus]MCA6063749.1 MoaD/ThiS family protein [Thalassolituus marinus]